jgi:hypothetical protein
MHGLLLIPELLNDMIRMELHQDDGLYLLTFDSDGDFLGGCIVAEKSHVMALFKATQLGLNPGGTCNASGQYEMSDFEPQWCNRLLNWDEIELLPERGSLS